MIRRFPAIWAWCWCAAALAQPASSDAPADTDVAQPATSAAEPVESADRVFVQDADGRWRSEPLSPGADGLESGESQSAAVPAYIAQLQFDGEVVGDHADLTARVRVEITRADGWFELPLGLDQALIYDSTYEEGTGRAAPAVPQAGASGVRWLFQGAGTHRLEIKFRLPIKATAAGRQLQLSLPPLPANYIARAVLRIPDANVQPLEPSSNVTLQKRVLESGMTELECDVAGARWDLTWRTETDAAPRIARVVTGVRVRADRDARLLRLVARQQCTVEQGGLGEILARLPSEFDLETVELAGMTLIADPDAARPGWTRVRLGESVQGEFELEWQLTRAFPSGGGAVIVDGLEVDGARWQGGTIEVESVEGYGARYQAEASAALSRGDVVERRPGEAALDFRFEFLRQPWVLAYELAPVTAQTDAEAEAFLAINTGSNDLYLDVHVEVLSGQVHELVIDWPNYAASGWTPKFARAEVVVNSGGAAEVVDGTLDQDALAADPHQLRVQLSRPCDGALSTLLRFTRVAPPQAGTLELQLPRPVATIPRPNVLTLASAVNLETTVTTVVGEPPREPPQVPREGPLPAGVPLQFGAAGVRVYELPADPPAVKVEWTEQRRTIVAETTVSAEILNPLAIHVEQDIAYDVSYGYVSTLLLEAPPAFRGGSLSAPVNAAGGIGFRVLLDGQELPAEARDNHWRVELPDPRRGRFQLKISHVIAAVAESGGEGAPRSVTVPILQSVDAPFQSTTVRLPGVPTLRLAEAETGWQSWLTRSGDRAWLTATQRLGVQLTIDDTARNIPQQFTINTAFVRTWFGDPSQITVYAEYVIPEAPQSVVLTLPPEAVAEFRWNGEVLEVGESDDGSGEYVIKLPVGNDETITGRLSVRYRAPRTRQLGLVSECAVEFPRFGDKVLVDGTYWEVVLPPGQQLFSPPAGLVAQYSWERETVLWVRRPTAEYQTLREQLTVHERDSASGIPRGNVYAYSSVGSVARGEFGAMAQSLIVLIGAGVSLLLGFAFRRLPATRNVLSVLVLGFLCALAALWQLELIQLLLQPAVLGLLLAVIAASFDAARRDRRAYRRDAESGLPAGDRRSTAVPLPPAIPTRTAVYHPEPVSEPGRSG